METHDIYVFGSNLAGKHTKGAALTASQSYGAIYGQGYGVQGNSFAIPTKDENLMALPLTKIKHYVDSFVKFAKLNPELTFVVTRIGCAFGEYDDAEIAPMFKDAPKNCKLPVGWRV